MDQFELYKRQAWERIIRDREIGYLDPDIFDLLQAFFMRPKTFTISSCSGRVTIVDSDLPWERKGSTVVFKDHLKVTEEDLRENLAKKPYKKYWLIVQGPIVHAYAKDLDEAWELLEIARKAGFKHSGIMTKNEKGYLVEFRTGVRMVHLLDENQDLGKIAEEAMRILMKGKEKKEKLRQAILESLDVNNPVELGQNPVR